jgi:hypothetical protein
MATNTSAFLVVNPNPAKKQPAMTPEPAPTFLWGQGTPDGDREPFLNAQKGTLYFAVDTTDDDNHIWQKVDEGGDDADWVQLGVQTQAPVNATASTLAVTAALHAGRVVTLNRAAGIAVTLPAATGTGNAYKFVVGTTFTGAASIAALTTDYFIGTATLYNDTDNTVSGFATANSGTPTTESDAISLFGTANAQGGIKGEVVDLIDIAAGVWSVRLVSDAGGSEATPFSVT